MEDWRNHHCHCSDVVFCQSCFWNLLQLHVPAQWRCETGPAAWITHALWPGWLFGLQGDTSSIFACAGRWCLSAVWGSGWSLLASEAHPLECRAVNQTVCAACSAHSHTHTHTPKHTHIYYTDTAKHKHIHCNVQHYTNLPFNQCYLVLKDPGGIV